MSTLSTAYLFADAAAAEAQSTTIRRRQRRDLDEDALHDGHDHQLRDAVAATHSISRAAEVGE
jgi:hypothetical protein